ncbi:alpha/beta hydrolase [Streptomyces sp. NPDC048664]|uniref:alpha/beta fold hydrolase n=1 Tax=Streptomyces sp. NPDC048664 TaxID=3154505 RepID=UPI003412EDD3
MSLRLADTRHGSGRTLVCHPGGPGMHPHYIEQLAALAGDRRRVVLLHPRGTGASPRPTDPLDYAVQAYADDLADWIRREADGPVDLLGHSHGGVVVARVAARHPQLVSSMVLLATPAYGGERAVKEAEALQRARADEPDCAQALRALEEQGDDYPSEVELGRLIARVVPLWVAPMTDRIRRWQAQVAEQPANVDALRYFNEQVFPVLDGVPADVAAAVCPILVLGGEGDGWAGPDHMALLTRAARDAVSVTLQNSGHMCHADSPEGVVAAIAKFLDGVPPPR